MYKLYFIFKYINRFLNFALELKLEQWLEIKIISFLFLQIHSSMPHLRPDSLTVHLTIFIQNQSLVFLELYSSPLSMVEG